MKQSSVGSSKSLFSVKDVAAVASGSIAYLVLAYIIIGFKADQIVLVGIFNALYFSSFQTRKLILGFLIFIVFWVLFDSMKAFPNYLFNTVHIESLYNAEKALFGIHREGTILTPNEYFKANGRLFLDLLAGLFYLCWIPVPLAFAVYLFIKNRLAFLQFSLTFLVVNLIGFVIYYLYPAAPPWYVENIGFHFIPHTPGNVAALSSFDQFTGVPVFAALYSKSSNVFAAMPSLHSAYPLIVFYYGLKHKIGMMNIFFGIVAIGIWFTAVYSRHHYLLDVFLGIGCAVAGIVLFNWLELKSTIVQKFLTKYHSLIR